MATIHGQREQELARRVRRMLIEQCAILQDESPDEFSGSRSTIVNEQRFFEEELGARLELRLGRWARAYWPPPPRQRELCIADVFELTARKQTAYACLIRAYRSVRLLEVRRLGHASSASPSFSATSPKRGSGSRPGSASTRASSTKRWRPVARPTPRPTMRLLEAQSTSAKGRKRSASTPRRRQRRQPRQESGRAAQQVAAPACARQPARVLSGVRRLRAPSADSPHRRRRPPAPRASSTSWTSATSAASTNSPT